MRGRCSRGFSWVDYLRVLARHLRRTLTSVGRAWLLGQCRSRLGGYAFLVYYLRALFLFRALLGWSGGGQVSGVGVRCLLSLQESGFSGGQMWMPRRCAAGARVSSYVFRRTPLWRVSGGPGVKLVRLGPYCSLCHGVLPLFQVTDRCRDVRRVCGGFLLSLCLLDAEWLLCVFLVTFLILLCRLCLRVFLLLLVFLGDVRLRGRVHRRGSRSVWGQAVRGGRWTRSNRWTIRIPGLRGG